MSGCSLQHEIIFKYDSITVWYGFIFFGDLLVVFFSIDSVVSSSYIHFRAYVLITREAAQTYMCSLSIDKGLTGLNPFSTNRALLNCYGKVDVFCSTDLQFYSRLQTLSVLC